jgi:hypothetical protein
MVMEKKDNFIKRYNYVKDDIIKCLDEALIRAIGNEVIEFDKLEDNYLDVYPLIGAVLKKKLDYIERGGDDTTCRKIKRKSTQYKNDYRIWHDYAGDYRTKNNIMKEQ